MEYKEDYLESSGENTLELTSSLSSLWASITNLLLLLLLLLSNIMVPCFSQSNLLLFLLAPLDLP